MTLDASMLVSVVATLGSALDLGSATAPVNKKYTTTLSTGTGAGQGDRLWHDQRTLAASATEDLDLAGGLTDALGSVMTLARVKGLVVVAAAANVNDVIVGGAVSNQFAAMFGAATHTLKVRPGARLALFCGAGDATGYAVTGGTGDLLRIGNGGAGSSVTYDIIILGASA